MPTEFVDGFITDLLESRKLRETEKEENYILAVENGEQDRLQREMFDKMARDKGMDADQIKTKMRELFEGIRLASETQLKDSQTQRIVNDYVSFLAGSGTDTELKRAWNTLSEPIFRRLFSAGDIMNGSKRGEMIYQMILDNLLLRLEQSQSGVDPT